jgi:bifunctional non-homologous end joining protein LigD
VPPPAGLRPMQPTAARELPADQGAWAFEPKWDGYRALGHVVAGGLALPSRNGVEMAGWFPELGGLAGALGGRAAVLDGEVVAFDDRGRPSFEALQQRMAGRAGRRRGAPVTYLVFDLLWLDGRLLTGLPYTERRRLLDDLEVAGGAWQTVGSFPGAGTALLGGLPDPRRKGRLRFAGRVDHGLVPAARRRVGDLLAPLVVDQSRFAEPPAVLLGGRWSRPGPDDPAPVFVRPAVAVEVTFLGWEGGRLRHPAYSGLAADGR